MFAFVTECGCCGKDVWGMSPPSEFTLCETCEREDREASDLLERHDPPGVNGPGWLD